LSDFPSDNIIYLKKKGNCVEILNSRDINPFGANISDLLKHSFFIQEGLIGDFAKSNIEDVINELNRLLTLKNNGDVIGLTENQINNIKGLITLVGEPLVQHKLIDMFNTIFDSEGNLNEEILRLEEQIQYLKNKQTRNND
jgi:hypothetical protein